MRTLTTSLSALALLFSFGCGTPEPDHNHEGETPSASSEPASSEAASSETTAEPDMNRPKRVYRFTYTATIPAPAEGTKVLRIWAPLPRPEEGVQEVADLKIVAPEGARQTVAPDFGNRFLYAEINNPTGPTKVEWSALITRYEDNGQGKGDQNPRFLKGTKLIDIEGSGADHAMKLTTKLELDKDGLTDTERAKRIYDDVLDEMEYDKKTAGYGTGDFIRSVEVCKGNCTDFHARFMGVGRKAGLPVRFTMGIPLKKGKASYNSYHCWAHWYDKDSDSWKPVDISEADKVVATDPDKAAWYFGNLGFNRITLTYGRDLTLEPAQSGPPLNYMVFPYAEADGKGVAMSKKDWLFTWADQE